MTKNHPWKTSQIFWHPGHLLAGYNHDHGRMQYAEVWKTVADYMKEDHKGAQILGVHLEGPFISPWPRGPC